MDTIIAADAAAARPRLTGFARGIHLPFQGDPLDWLEEHVQFPHSARSTRFTRQQGPWWNDVIAQFSNPRTRQIYVRACTGAGKSTLLEALSTLIVAHDPGPSLFITQTDQTAVDWMEQRLLPVLHNCKPVAALMPSNRFKVRKDAIIFSHMALMAGGSNISNAQEKSVKHLFLDEAWTYSSLIGQFKARHHDRFDRKTVIVSQAHEEPHQLDDEWDAGKRHYWAFDCLKCGALVKPDWTNYKYDEVKNEHGEWQWGALSASVRHVCPHCEHVTADTTQARRALADRSRWVAEDGDAMDGHVSYWLPAQCVWWIKWSDLVISWVRANDAKHLGLLEPLKDFKMKKLAQPWPKELELPAVEMEAADYNAADMEDGRAIADEMIRLMTIDVQQDHYWAVIRAWTNSGTSRLLYCGRVLTLDKLREIQPRYKVPDKKTCMDAGNSFHGVVYDRCAQYGWTALIGRGEDWFSSKNKQGRTIRRLYSKPDYVPAPTTKSKQTGRSAMVLFFHWASDPVKDVLARLRTIGSPTWEFPHDVPREYLLHLNSERKRDVVDKITKRTRKRWTKTHRPNHLWDCEAMQVVVAMMLGALPDLSEDVVDEPPANE